MNITRIKFTVEYCHGFSSCTFSLTVQRQEDGANGQYSDEIVLISSASMNIHLINALLDYS